MQPPLICGFCDEPLKPDASTITLPVLQENGFEIVAFHLVCQLRRTVGGMNHLLKRCACYGFDNPNDPEGASRYQSAVIAAALWSTFNE